MIQTNLIGRKFRSKETDTVFRVVVVCIVSNSLIVVGEDDKGLMQGFTLGLIVLLPNG